MPSSPWWRHQIEAISALLALCEGSHCSPVNSPHKDQWGVAMVFFYMRLNKLMSKQSIRRWSETPSRSLWRHCHEVLHWTPPHSVTEHSLLQCKDNHTRTTCLMDCQLPWWRHQMETFSALLAICAGNSPVPGEFPTQRPVTRSFDVYFDLNSWVNNGEAGDLRRHPGHYDVIVMTLDHRRTVTEASRVGSHFNNGY